MYRFTLKATKFPLATGVVAAFGSLWLTCKDQLYYTNSYGSLLWQYFVPSFLKTGGQPNASRRHPSGPKESRKLPHVEIRRNEKLVPVNIDVVSHYESNHLASNDPIEDRNAEYRVLDGLLFSVFDGHSGWQCAEEVMNRLPFYVAVSLASEHGYGIAELSELERTLSDVTQLGGTQCAIKDYKDILGPKTQDFIRKGTFKNGSVEHQLIRAYALLDNDIVHEALPDVNGYDNTNIMKGLSGACAITAYIKGKDLFVSNAGDCRAVLGSKTPDGNWLATPLSQDQNALNRAEIERIYAEHPGEESIIWNGRLFGNLQPLRAFGDVVFKWDSELHTRFLNSIYGRVVIKPHVYRTPPYLTAEPVVEHHSLEAQDKFLVIATDGLWDMMSSDDAVQCVGELLESGDVSALDQDGNTVRFNGASVLIQDALGGSDDATVIKLLNAPKHVRRAVRDDITVTVVYFTER